MPVLARIQQFSCAHTHSTIFPYWSGQFFGTRTDSTVCRYSPGFNNYLVLTLILPFSRSGADSFSAHARIPTFAGTRPDSAMFRYSHSFYHFSVLVRTIFRYSHGFNHLPYSPGFNNFLVLTLILPFFRTGPNSFSALARIPPFAGTRPDSTIF